MAHAVKIPAVGESITEGTLSRWLVADGAVVTDSTPLFELETDKISTEVQSGVAGKVTFKAKEGEVLAIGAVVAEIDTTVVATVGAGSGERGAGKVAAAPAPTAAASAPPKSGPAAEKALAETGVDPSTITGTGKDGRITKGDVAAAAAVPAPRSPLPAPESIPAASPTAATGVSRKRMTPLRQRIAQRLVQAQHTAAILTTFNEVDMTAAMDLRKKWKEDFEKKHGTGLGFMSIFSIAAVKALQKFPASTARSTAPMWYRSTTSTSASPWAPRRAWSCQCSSTLRTWASRTSRRPSAATR